MHPGDEERWMLQGDPGVAIDGSTVPAQAAHRAKRDVGGLVVFNHPVRAQR
jgi:hypothetical protein